MRAVFISWAPNCSRSDNIARELGAPSFMVYKESLGSNPLTVGFKYIWQAVETWRILRRERADTAFVMTPPLFAGLSLYLYSRVLPLKYVVDVHTAALLMPRWQRLLWLQNFVCRHAVTTTVTNDHLGGIIQRGGGDTTILRDVPVQYPVNDRYAKPQRFRLAVVCSFNYDEPIAEILEAAAKLPDIDFAFTGDHKRVPADVKARVTPNVTFTGFLDAADYGSLLTHSHAVMSLTTRDHTMLRGAYEAVYLGSPVVVSDFPLLRDAFDTGAVHVHSDAQAIEQGLRELKQNIATYAEGARTLRQKKLGQWNEAKARILAKLERA